MGRNLKILNKRIVLNKRNLKKLNSKHSTLTDKTLPQSLKKTEKKLQNDLESQNYLSGLMARSEQALLAERTKERQGQVDLRFKTLSMTTNDKLKILKNTTRQNQNLSKSKFKKIEADVKQNLENGDQNSEKIGAIEEKIERLRSTKEDEREVVEGNLQQIENDFRSLENKIDGNFEMAEKKLKGLKNKINDVDARVYTNELMSRAQSQLLSDPRSKK